MRRADEIDAAYWGYIAKDARLMVTGIIIASALAAIVCYLIGGAVIRNWAIASATIFVAMQVNRLLRWRYLAAHRPTSSACEPEPPSRTE